MFSKVMWVGRATVFLVGLAVILALVLGVATTALGANGKPFLLGKKNVASAISTLVKQGPGPALKLQVGAGQPPMAVNSQGRVANLNAARAGRADSAARADSATNAQNAVNADKLDNKDSSAFAGTGMSHYAGSTSALEGCNEKVLLSSEISPSRPALVYASGVSVYEPNGGAAGGVLQLELRNATNTTTLASGGNMYVNGGGNAVPLSAQGVLMSGSDVYTPSTPFEVTPGNRYVLRLVGNATDGCSTGNSGSMEYVTLSYVLIGK